MKAIRYAPVIGTVQADKNGNFDFVSTNEALFVHGDQLLLEATVPTPTVPDAQWPATNAATSWSGSASTISLTGKRWGARQMIA